MKARIPSRELYTFYDKVIAKDIEAIAEMAWYDEKKEETYIGISYDGSLESKYLFQIAKIYCSCVKGVVKLFVNCSKKTLNELKKKNTSVELVKINPINKHKLLFIIKPSYIQAHNKKLFYKEHYYTEDIIEKIWQAYYTPEEFEDDI